MSAASENLALAGEAIELEGSAIPSWLRLKSPLPSVRMADSLRSIVWSMRGSGSRSASGSAWLVTEEPWDLGRLVLLLLLPMVIPVPGMVLLNVVAAFCAAVSTDEKKPVALGVGSPLSSVGVRGAVVMLESLLGAITADPDLALRCALMLCNDGLLPSKLTRKPPPFRADLVSGEDPRTESPLSVGVGGVLTITGAALSDVGGVRGGFVSSDGGCLERRSADDTLTAAGGSMTMGGAVVSRSTAAGDEVVSLPARPPCDEGAGWK